MADITPETFTLEALIGGQIADFQDVSDIASIHGDVGAEPPRHVYVDISLIVTGRHLDTTPVLTRSRGGGESLSKVNGVQARKHENQLDPDVVCSNGHRAVVGVPRPGA